MDNTTQQPAKITLPKDLQREMLKFFLKTSIPRKKYGDKNKINLLSETENKSDGSVEK